MSTALIDELKSLPVTERLDLVEQLWDSIAADSDSIPLTDAQARLIDERLESHRKAPKSGIALDTLRTELKNRA